MQYYLLTTFWFYYALNNISFILSQRTSGKSSLFNKPNFAPAKTYTQTPDLNLVSYIYKCFPGILKRRTFLVHVGKLRVKKFKIIKNFVNFAKVNRNFKYGLVWASKTQGKITLLLTPKKRTFYFKNLFRMFNFTSLPDCRKLSNFHMRRPKLSHTWPQWDSNPYSWEIYPGPPWSSG